MNVPVDTPSTIPSTSLLVPDRINPKAIPTGVKTANTKISQMKVFFGVFAFVNEIPYNI